ncbi:hypothetical protein MRX96_022940 [Rhipicephalus microplus]
MHRLRESGLGFDLNYMEEGSTNIRHIPALFYADDIVLLANYPEELQDLLNICGEEGTKLGFTFSVRREFLASAIDQHDRETLEPNSHCCYANASRCVLPFCTSGNDALTLRYGFGHGADAAGVGSLGGRNLGGRTEHQFDRWLAGPRARPRARQWGLSAARTGRGPRSKQRLGSVVPPTRSCTSQFVATADPARNYDGGSSLRARAHDAGHHSRRGGATPVHFTPPRNTRRSSRDCGGASLLRVHPSPGVGSKHNTTRTQQKRTPLHSTDEARCGKTADATTGRAVPYCGRRSGGPDDRVSRLRPAIAPLADRFEWPSLSRAASFEREGAAK